MVKVTSPQAHMSKGKQLLIIAAVSVFLSYLVEKFFNFLFKPFYDEESASDKIERNIEAKQEARKEYLYEVEMDEFDPMYQFQHRFITEPKLYRGDEDNATYRQWYEDWKQGEIIDSELRWFPPIYKDGSFTSNFLEYMKIQFALHKKASFTQKATFFKIIRKFYPEFTASMKGLEEDLSRYDSMVKTEVLTEVLSEEIQKYGLSEELAKYLSEKNLTTRRLKKQAKYLKDCIEKGCREEVAVEALESGMNLEDAAALNAFVEQGLPIQVGRALVGGEIKEADAEDILEGVSLLEGNSDSVDFYRPYYDEALGKFSSVYDRSVKELLEGAVAKRRAARF